MQDSRTAGDFWRDLPRPGVMCTIIRVSGHHPQEVGARMWVSRDGAIGTLGGGEFERRVLAHALELFVADEPTAHVEEYVLCREMRQCCGGRAEVFFEYVPRPARVHVFGGGHVGGALMQVLAGLPLEPHVIDARPNWSTERSWPNGVRVHGADPMSYARELRPDRRDAVCILTHSHDLDLELARHFLDRPVGYLGVIGSRHKARVFRARLGADPDPVMAERLTRSWDETVHCPMGRPVPSKSPKAIAIAIASELLDVWAFGRVARATSRDGLVRADPAGARHTSDGKSDAGGVATAPELDSPTGAPESDRR